MIDVIKKTLLAGVGAVVVTKEKVQDSLDDFVRQGKVSAADARIMAEKIAEQGKREFDDATQNLSVKIKDLLSRDSEKILSRLTALEERIRVLETKLAEPPTRSGEP